MLSVILLTAISLPTAFDPKLDQLNSPANEFSVESARIAQP